MPLSSKLALEPTARSASEARRWVGDICRTLQRGDLVDSATLGVSELVTNAVLHGAPPIRVQVRGTADHPRVEVHDGSAEFPLDPATGPTASDAEPTTFGRGLDIVARCSRSWGVTATDDGKVVWFEPGDEAEEDYVPATLDLPDRYGIGDHLPPGGPTVKVRLLDFDLTLMAGLRTHYTELRREVRLLALAHRDSYPLAGELVTLFEEFERQFPLAFRDDVAAALAEGAKATDLSVDIPVSAAPLMATMIDMFDLADEFCRAQQMLSLERTPAQQAFQTWMLSEFVRQVPGGLPHPWVPCDDPDGS